jgi:hypothetical protein
MAKSYEFEKQIPNISPEIVEALQGLGDEAIAAYASVELRHNTLSKFENVILEEGLNADNNDAVPDSEDVEFAKELFRSKDILTPDKATQFSRYVEGVPDDQPSGGIYFYGATEGHKPNNHYGIPERMVILAKEMGNVMVRDDGTFSDEERKKAGEIYRKYREVIYGDPDTHISIIRANPFSPNIINARLINLPEAVKIDSKERIIQVLRLLDLGEFHGIYIPGSIPAKDIEVLDVQLPLWPGKEYLGVENLDPFKSRFR